MSPQCGNCGSHVSVDYVRVFSASEEVEACPECAKRGWADDYDYEVGSA